MRRWQFTPHSLSATCKHSARFTLLSHLLSNYSNNPLDNFSESARRQTQKKIKRETNFAKLFKTDEAVYLRNQSKM